MKYRFITTALFLLAVFGSCWKSDYSRIADTISKIKDKPEITIVIVGDSVTGFETGGAGSTYASLLKPKFAELLGARVSLINSSRADLTFDQARRFYQEDILSFRPDIVFIMLGMVDAGQTQTYFSMFQESISGYFNLLKREETLVIVLTPPGYDERGRKQGLQERLDEFCEEIVRQSRISHFPVIDVARRMNDLWTGNRERHRRLFSGPAYLSDEGHEFVADYIMTTIRRTMEQAGGD